MNPLEIFLATYLDVLGIIKYDVSKSYRVKFTLNVVSLQYFVNFKCKPPVLMTNQSNHPLKKKKRKIEAIPLSNWRPYHGLRLESKKIIRNVTAGRRDLS